MYLGANIPNNLKNSLNYGHIKKKKEIKLKFDLIVT